MMQKSGWRGLLMSLGLAVVACGSSTTTGSSQACAVSCTAGESCVAGSCVPLEGGMPEGGRSGGGAGGGVPRGGAPNGGAPNGGAPNGGAPNGGAPNGGASAPDPTGFCQRWIDEFARYMGTCGCDTATVQNYRDKNASFCSAGSFLVTAATPDAGAGLVYHADAADALFARLAAPDPLCVEEPFRALKLDSLELYSLGGVFTGTRALGSPCTGPVGYKGGISDCREGVCAPNTTGGGGVCISLVGAGEECDASGDHNFNSGTKRLCFDRRPSDTDGEYESAFDSLSCVPSVSGGTKRVCARDLANGEPCNSDEGCRSGRCLGTGTPHVAFCAPKTLDGQPCTSHAECEHGACQNGTPRVCGAPLGDGEPCAFDVHACASGSCNDPNGSGGFCGPAATRGIGEPCSSSIECVGSGSGNSRDKVCAAGHCIADICANYLP
jgi:hypothetical protein